MKERYGTYEQVNGGVVNDLKDEIKQIRQELRRLGDHAYCKALEVARRPECLGVDFKLERGQFGRAELEAHRESELWMGKHRAFYEALRLLPTEERGRT